MDRPEHAKARFFVGTEVEHSPAFGKRTLFVIGVQPTDDILLHAEEQEVNHIYFGANQSFPNPDTNDSVTWTQWENMIWTCMSRGYQCTLDLDVTAAEGLLESRLVEMDSFIPMISVKLPYIQQYGYNATIKLDDVDFRATNPGVWTHSLHDLRNTKSFTDWSKYTQDTVIS